MWTGTYYAPYSMYMYVYTGHLLCGGQALGRHLTGHLLCGGQAFGTYLIVCICMYILGTCYVEGRHLVRTL